MAIKKYEELSLMDFVDSTEGTILDRARAFREYCDEGRKRGHFNYRRISLNGSSPMVDVVDPDTGLVKKMVYLASNDYLNLTKHPLVIEAGLDALRKYGAGAGSVPLLGGTFDIHRDLEKKAAAFKSCEDSLMFTSGFGGNSGCLQAILGKDDLAILDILDHASIVDGCRLTNVKFFRHNDMNSLESILKRYAKLHRTTIIVVDGVYSMDGDIAPLDIICELAKKYGALTMVDEAHATGVIGKCGRGTPEYFGLEGKIDFVSGTFSKALGGVGGFVAAKRDVIEYLHFYARSYMFSTSLAPQVVGSTIKAMDIIENDHILRSKLWDNITYFKHQIELLGFSIGNSESAIIPIIIKNDVLVKDACRMLHDRGVYVNPVLYPAVKKSQARIRVSITAGLEREHLDIALNAFEDMKQKYCIK